MATVTGLTAAKMLELSAEWKSAIGGITGPGGSISELNRSLAENRALLAELNDVHLPVLQTDLATNTAVLTTLNNETLPLLQGSLSGNTASIANLNDVVIPGLNANLNNLNNVVIPDLNARLNQAQLDIANIQPFDPSSLQAEITALQGKFPVVGTDISDGAISTPKMTANSINGDRILANTLHAAKIIALSITANELAANSIIASKILAGEIVTAHMVVNAISGDRITANTLHADKITANTFSGNAIIANTINGDRIISNTLNANRIVSQSIYTDLLAFNAINGDRIAANTLNADKIITNTLHGDKIIANTIWGDRIVTNTLNGDRIVANTVHGDRIIANTITTGKLQANAIDGMLITGATIRTGTTGHWAKLYGASGMGFLMFEHATQGLMGVIAAAESLSDGIVLCGPNGILGSGRIELKNAAVNIHGNLNLNGNNLSNVGSIFGGFQLSGGNMNLNAQSINMGGGSIIGSIIASSLADGGSNNSATGGKFVRCSPNGTLYAHTTSPSSRDIKHDINHLSDIMDYRKILELEPVTFRYNDTPGHLRLGFIAENARDLGLDVLTSYEDQQFSNKVTGFDYEGFDAALLLVAQEQDRQLEDQDRRISYLEEQLALLTN